MEVENLWKGFRDIIGEEAMLFVSDDFGVPYQPNAVTRFLGSLHGTLRSQENSLPGFGHSSASLILSYGVNMIVLQNRLGHRNIKTTLNIFLISLKRTMNKR